MKPSPIETRLRQLDDLDDAEAAAVLREALAHKTGAMVARAAVRLVERADSAWLEPLSEAFRRLQADPLKRDPGCLGQVAVLKALGALGCSDRSLWLQALRHQQLEPVYGGREDTAGPVRGQAALGLARSGLPEAASDIVELLVDGNPSTRLTAVRALAFLGGPEAALVLRLRVLVGDRVNPDLELECLEAVLRLEGAAALPFVARFLEQPEQFESAVLALGSSGLREAIPLLLQAWHSDPRRPSRRAVLAGLLGLRAREQLRALAQEEWVRDYLLEIDPYLFREADSRP